MKPSKNRTSSLASRSRLRRLRKSRRLILESLESRRLLAATEWIGADGGDFGVATNWMPAFVPGASDEAQFLIPSHNKVINFTADHTVEDLTVEGDTTSANSGKPDVTFDLNGNHLDISNDLVVGGERPNNLYNTAPDGFLTIVDGSVEAHSVNLGIPFDSDGGDAAELTISNASVTTTSLWVAHEQGDTQAVLNVLNGSSLVVGNTTNSDVDSSASAKFNIVGQDSLFSAGRFSGDGYEVEIRDGGRLNARLDNLGSNTQFDLASGIINLTEVLPTTASLEATGFGIVISRVNPPSWLGNVGLAGADLVTAPTGVVDLATHIDIPSGERAKVYSTGTSDLGGVTLDGGLLISEQPIRFGVDDIVSGHGQIATSVLANGNVSPSSPSPGAGVLIVSDIAMSSTSTLTVQQEASGSTNFDHVSVSGTVAVAGSLEVLMQGSVAIGEAIVILNNNNVAPIVGTFSGLPEGARFSAGDNDFEISYVGGDGNDIELTAVTPLDFGDAPDLGIGTGTGDYQTSESDNGPRHIRTPSVFLGAAVDSDFHAASGTLATTDDLTGIIPGDEDGVVSPLDLQATAGSQASIALVATNQTGVDAILSGWIDYNQDGVFDDATERGQITVPAGSDAGRFSLTMPAIPLNAVGETFARFRLSTDAAASTSTGLATDGEVEDYAFRIDQPSDFEIDSFVEFSDDTDPGNVTGFGLSITSIGDVDGDGTPDLLVGLPAANADPNDNRGAVKVLRMNADGSVKSSLLIGHELNGGPTLAENVRFGNALANLGDLDGDGISDMAVSAYGANLFRGEVHVLFMNADQTVKSTTTIGDQVNGGPMLADFDGFGNSLASIGDVNGDGVPDLLVGSANEIAYVLMMSTDGTVNEFTEITNPDGSLSDRFGYTVSAIGDLDDDGIVDAVVGAPNDSTGGQFFGAFYTFFLNADGTVKSWTKVANETNGGPTLEALARLGNVLSPAGDLDGDGVVDLFAGMSGDSAGEVIPRAYGGLFTLFMNADGSVKSFNKMNRLTPDAPLLTEGMRFGQSLVSVGDLNNAGVPDLVVGSTLLGDPKFHVIFFDSPIIEPTVHVTNANDSGAGSLRAAIEFANTSPGVDAVHFDIPGVGPHSIDLLSPLPTVLDTTIIDATTDSDANGIPLVGINGSGLTGIADGFRLDGSGSQVSGFAIHGFTGDGIEILGDQHTVSENWIGLDIAATADGNRFGIRIGGAGSNEIDDNTISGNNGTGVLINKTTATANELTNNRIGTDPTGTGAIENKGAGISLSSADNVIGKRSAGNVISGNDGVGLVVNPTATNTTIKGNRIGTSADGESAVPNSKYGVLLRSSGNFVGGDPYIGQGNQISGNGRSGLVVSGTSANDNIVRGNLIGTNGDGTIAVPNSAMGILITGGDGNQIGGPSIDHANLISGNNASGIVVSGGGSSNVIQHNGIGLDATTELALPNGSIGIYLRAGANDTQVRQNLIAGNVGTQILLVGPSTTSNLLHGNMIGLNLTSDVVPGGSNAIVVKAAGNTITANQIAGSSTGILLSSVNANNNTIASNYIGTDDTLNDHGMTSGVRFTNSAHTNTLGPDNTIAYNSSRAVQMTTTAGNQNTITQNVMFDNGFGIDILSPGGRLNANDSGDADDGANLRQNSATSFVVNATPVVPASFEISFDYFIDSDPANVAYPLTVEFYSATFDPANLQTVQGDVYVAFDTYTEADFASNGTSYSLTIEALASQLPTHGTAIATDAHGNTSEFTFPVPINFSMAAMSAPLTTNPLNPLDVNGQDGVTLSDALVVINYLSNAASSVAGEVPIQAMTDVNQDGLTTPADLLLIINHLSDQANQRKSAVDYLPESREDEVYDEVDWDLALIELTTEL